MTLKTAINEVQRLCSLPVTSAVVADGQESQQLLWSLANREARDVIRRHAWPQLRREHTFTSNTASLQTNGRPANFERIIAGTFWNRASDRELMGPLEATEWALAYGEPFTSAIQQYWMLRHDGLHIFPVPTAAEAMAYEYQMTTPVLAADGTTFRRQFEADTDTYVLDEELLILGVTYRFLKQKGLDYAEALRDYELALSTAIGSAKGAKIINLAPEEADVPLPLIPESGYGQ